VTIVTSQTSDFPPFHGVMQVHQDVHHICLTIWKVFCQLQSDRAPDNVIQDVVIVIYKRCIERSVTSVLMMWCDCVTVHGSVGQGEYWLWSVWSAGSLQWPGLLRLPRCLPQVSLMSLVDSTASPHVQTHTCTLAHCLLLIVHMYRHTHAHWYTVCCWSSTCTDKHVHTGTLSAVDSPHVQTHTGTLSAVDSPHLKTHTGTLSAVDSPHVQTHTGTLAHCLLLIVYTYRHTLAHWHTVCCW